MGDRTGRRTVRDRTGRSRLLEDIEERRTVGTEQGGGCRLLEDIEERRTVRDRTGRRV